MRRQPPRIVSLVIAVAAAALLVGAGSGAALADPAAPAAAEGTPVCRKGEVRQRVETDRDRYVRGAPVTITVIARNVSDHECALPSIVWVSVRSSSGQTVWRSSVIIDWIPTATWRPGEAIRWQFTWDQQICSENGCRTARPGEYFAFGAWNDYPPALTGFTIRPRR